MPDYYNSDLTLLPYSVLFDKQTGLPLLAGLFIAFRKWIGWHYSPASGRAIEVDWKPLQSQDLPSSIREDFATKIQTFTSREFESAGINRVNHIGYLVQYTCLLISPDRFTLASVSAIRVQFGSLTQEVRAIGLRTDLRDGTLLVTGSGDKVAQYLIKENHKLEFLPTETPIATLLQRHSARLLPFDPNEIVPIPTENTLPFLIDRGMTYLHEQFASPFFRKLTEKEVAALKTVEFDFE